MRLVEIYLSQRDRAVFNAEIEDIRITDMWEDRLADDKVLLRLLLPVEDTALLMDRLEKLFGGSRDFRILLLPVEAAIPRGAPGDQTAQAVPEAVESSEAKASKISREELYADIEVSTRLTGTYLFLVALSTVVGAIGLLRSNTAVIIGAMVIAPLLGPNVGLSLATTLGDAGLAVRSVKVAAAGGFLALAFAGIMGILLRVDPASPEILSRTAVSLSDVLLALAAGSAAALSFTSGIPSALIGVMVAVALLPPLVTLGMLLGGGHLVPALGAFLLVMVNLVCINLAGVVTFLAQGIRPLTWWEKSRARRATRNAIFIWSLLLALLVALILIAKR